MTNKNSAATIPIPRVEELQRLIDNFEFSKAMAIMKNLDIMDYGEEKNTMLSNVSKYLTAFDYINASVECKRLLTVINSGDMAKDATKMTILAVDDMPDTLNTLKAMLKHHYNIYPVTTGAMALKFLNKQKVNLILLDIEMPDINGYDLLKEIRKIPHQKDTPIVFLTSNATSEYVVKARILGAVDFIVKPTDREKLLEKVGKHIKRTFK